MNVVYCDKESCLKNNYYYALSTPSAPNPTQIPISHTGIADSGASGFFFSPDAPVTNRNPHAPTMCVRVANGLPEKSQASATLASVPSLPAEAMQGHIMPSFPNTLIGLGPFADLGYKIVFTKTAVSVIHPDGHSILEGWREQTGAKLWMFPLDPPKPRSPRTAVPPSGEPLCLNPGQRGSSANFSKPPLAEAAQGANKANLPSPVPAPVRFQKPRRPHKKPIKTIKLPPTPPPEPPQSTSLLHPSQGMQATNS